MNIYHSIQETINEVYLGTHNQNPAYYHTVQTTQFACISFISTALLTRVSPKKGALFMSLAYLISRAIKPYLVRLFESYKNVALIPLTGHVILLSGSTFLSRSAVNFLYQNFSLREMRNVTVSFVTVLFLFHLAKIKLSKNN